MKQRRNDLILVAVILVVAVLFWGYSWFTRSEGGYAVVTVDGEEWGRYALDKPLETEIVTPYGTNILVIADGKASVTEADCPDGLCVRQRDICYEGETLVCLPHKLVVEIAGSSEGDVDWVVD